MYQLRIQTQQAFTEDMRAVYLETLQYPIQFRILFEDPDGTIVDEVGAEDRLRARIFATAILDVVDNQVRLRNKRHRVGAALEVFQNFINQDAFPGSKILRDEVLENPGLYDPTLADLARKAAKSHSG